MKRLIIKTLIGLSLAIIITLGILGLSFPYFQKHRLPAQKHALLEKYPSKAINLVLGSSHSVYGINTKKWGAHWFNASSFSQTYYEDFQILKQTSTKHRIDTILLPISYFSNFYAIDKQIVTGEKLRLFDYLPFYDVSYSFTPATCYQYSASILKLLFYPHAKPFKFDGLGNFISPIRNAKNPFKDSAKTFIRHNVGCNFNTFNPSLDSIYQWCQKHHTALYFYVNPMPNPYKNVLISAKKQVPFVKFINRVSNLRGVKVISTDGVFTSHQHLYYKDADHLNAAGRDSLSSFLHLHIR